ncbi:winged helix-turn-helix domain-containing protein [Flavobacterium sp. 25HG05S-40]|uniref:winged helix-turn-helix domain-containing protein n=1 Tax=Flavobacterium sp. 25HG05S-40 TaxID=3458682 RepID=UPI004044A0B8
MSTVLNNEKFVCNLLNMGPRKIYFYSSLCLALIAAIVFLTSKKNIETSPELVKIALRDVGNKLLLSNQDSTSLILPVQKVNMSLYKLSFEKTLAINPDSLVAIVAKSFQKANLPNHYQIEVKHCIDDEVAYSFIKYTLEEKSIIPCSGRFLPKKCYTIEVLIFKKSGWFTNDFLWVGLLLVSLILSFIFFPKKKKVTAIDLSAENCIPLGKFKFFPAENKLIVKAIEISLSKKEVELLTLFIANPNKIIKREELSKKVWEDHGVFVGRSLDTYVSKLRKKLSDDDSIKLTNVHGIGYMLEVK